jgi:hypothetical protein
MAYGDSVQLTNGGANAAVAYGVNCTAGNLLICAFHNATGTTASVADTLGNNYVLVGSPDSATGKVWVFAAYCVSSGANTQTITTSGSVSNHFVMEYEGPFIAVPFVDSSSTTQPNGTSATLATGDFTGVRADTFYFSFFLTLEDATGTGAWTQDFDGTPGGGIFFIVQHVVAGLTTTNPSVTTANRLEGWAIGGAFSPVATLSIGSGAYVITGADAALELSFSVNEGLVFDYVLAQESGEPIWPCRITQMADWAVPVYLNGERVVLYTKSGSNQIWVMGADDTGTLTSYIDLPWMSRLDDTKVAKWLGLVAAYSSTVPVDVYVRYANNPGEFESAVFTLRGTLPANPTIAEGARIGFGGSTRWVQVRFQADTLNGGGFELFPPVHLIPVDTMRIPN